MREKEVNFREMILTVVNLLEEKKCLKSSELNLYANATIFYLAYEQSMTSYMCGYFGVLSQEKQRARRQTCSSSILFSSSILYGQANDAENKGETHKQKEKNSQGRKLTKKAKVKSLRYSSSRKQYWNFFLFFSFEVWSLLFSKFSPFFFLFSNLFLR